MGIDYQRESWEAWVSHDSKKALRRVVKTLLDSNAGLTCDEVEVLTGMSHQTASATISHASRRGLLLKSGLRRPTRTGRKAQVYQLGTPPEATDGNGKGDGVVEKKRSATAASSEGHADRGRIDQQGLDPALRAVEGEAQTQRKASDLYRRSRVREDSDGSFFGGGNLFA